MISQETVQILAQEVVMSASKLYVEDEGELQPKAFLVNPQKHVEGVDGFKTGDGVLALLPLPGWSNAQEKQSVFSKLNRFFKLAQPDAVILAKDSYMALPVKVNTKEEADEFMENYKPGDLSQDPDAFECIIVAAKGPNIKPIFMAAPYRKNDVGDIEWLPLPEIIQDYDLNGVQLGLIQNWWEESQ